MRYQPCQLVPTFKKRWRCLHIMAAFWWMLKWSVRQMVPFRLPCSWIWLLLYLLLYVTTIACRLTVCTFQFDFISDYYCYCPSCFGQLLSCSVTFKIVLPFYLWLYYNICIILLSLICYRLDQMFSDAFSHDHQLLKTDPKHGLYLACSLMVRGQVEISDIRRNIER